MKDDTLHLGEGKFHRHTGSISKGGLFAYHPWVRVRVTKLYPLARAVEP
jgi:hypothetical protein